jgi:porin
MNQLLKFFTFSVAFVSSQHVLAIDPLATDTTWLFGDWNGNRQKLADQGYSFDINVMNQTATLLDGGASNNHQTRNANQLWIGSKFDLEKITNWKNTTAALAITKRDGHNLATDIGMQGSPTEIYGRGGIWRLSQAWIKSNFFDHKLDIKVGRMGISEDFNSSHCEFQSLTLCGDQVGKSQGSVWYGAPVSGWAFNLKYHFSPEWTIGLGAYENNSKNVSTTKSAGFNLGLKDTKGVLIPIELLFKTNKFNQLDGHYKIGGFITTHKYQDITLSNEVNNQESAKASLWFSGQQQLTAKEVGSKRGLYGAFSFIFNDRDTVSISDTQQIAFWYNGAINTRPNDQIGFGMGRYHFNQNAPGNSEKNQELDFELHYTYQYSPAIMLRPNIQYIYRPAGLKQIDNAWVAGMSVKLHF